MPRGFFPGRKGRVLPFSPLTENGSATSRENISGSCGSRGGEPVNLGPGIPSAVHGASWGLEGDIVMGAVGTPGLYRLPAAGGGLDAITSLDEDTGENAHTSPEFLPNGKAVLFTVASNVTSGRIEALDLESRSRRTIIAKGSVPRYIEGGYLVYCDGDVLNAVHFDAETLGVTGSPVPVLNAELSPTSPRRRRERNGQFAGWTGMASPSPFRWTSRLMIRPASRRMKDGWHW